uniref:Thioredoxin domain-containing protein n=1 Tax=Leptobrachium leishanense TaxID=445787 RepID=A0A8C5RBA5_9ANUR
MPGLLLGEIFPDFEAETTVGRISLHKFLGDKWGVLFSHPRDYTPVCTTELGRAVKMAPEFKKRNVQMIALSIDSVPDHLSWSKDINSYNCEEPTETLPFPIIADPKRDLAVKLGMLDPDEKDLEGMPVTARCETKSTFTCACCLPGMNMGFLDKVVNINTKPTTSVCENFNVFQMLMSTSRIKWKLWLLEDIFNSRRRSCVKSEEMEVHDQNASTSCTCSSYQEFLPRRFQK